MAEVRLIEIDRQLGERLQSDARGFETAYGCRLGDADAYVREVVEQALLLSGKTADDPWYHAYLAADCDSGQLTGMGGFKSESPAARDGVVEMAHLTFPLFERQGYGTALGRALLLQAASTAGVTRIVVHTRPEASPATRMLERLGMRLSAEPVEGGADSHQNIWRWESAVSRRE